MVKKIGTIYASENELRIINQHSDRLASIAEFMNQFVGAENPIDDAICLLLYKLQEQGIYTTGFSAQARKYLVEAQESDKAKTILKTFIYRHPVSVEVGVERFIVTKEISGETIETKSCVDVPLNNNGQEVHEGWLGSWTEGNTTTDSYCHGLRTVVKIDPQYGWNHELDQQ